MLAVDRSRSEFGESVKAVRMHSDMAHERIEKVIIQIKDVELYIRDHYVEVDSFNKVMDRIEDAQAGIGRIARQQDHLDPRVLRAGALIQRQQLAHHREGHAGPEDIVLVLALEFGIGRHAIALEQ